MSPKLKCHPNWNFTKTKISPKLKCYQNWNFIELKCHQNRNVTKTKMSPKLQCFQNWNVTKTKMLPKLKCYQNWNVTKSKNIIKIQIWILRKIQEIGTDHLGLVILSIQIIAIYFKSYLTTESVSETMNFPPLDAAHEEKYIQGVYSLIVIYIIFLLLF